MKLDDFKEAARKATRSRKRGHDSLFVIPAPRSIESEVRKTEAARAALEGAQSRYTRAMQAAVFRCCQEGVSMRHTGVLLGVSHQRVHQVTESIAWLRCKGCRAWYPGDAHLDHDGGVAFALVDGWKSGWPGELHCAECWPSQHARAREEDPCET